VAGRANSYRLFDRDFPRTGVAQRASIPDRVVYKLIAVVVHSDEPVSRWHFRLSGTRIVSEAALEGAALDPRWQTS